MMFYPEKFKFQLITAYLYNLWQLFDFSDSQFLWLYYLNNVAIIL